MFRNVTFNDKIIDKPLLLSTLFPMIQKINNYFNNINYHCFSPSSLAKSESLSLKLLSDLFDSLTHHEFFQFPVYHLDSIFLLILLYIIAKPFPVVINYLCYGIPHCFFHFNSEMYVMLASLTILFTFTHANSVLVHMCKVAV